MNISFSLLLATMDLGLAIGLMVVVAVVFGGGRVRGISVFVCRRMGNFESVIKKEKNFLQRKKFSEKSFPKTLDKFRSCVIM